jgi:hypothetical protein
MALEDRPVPCLLSVNQDDTPMSRDEVRAAASTGINRNGVADERAVQERTRDPSRLRGTPIGNGRDEVDRTPPNWYVRKLWIRWRKRFNPIEGQGRAGRRGFVPADKRQGRIWDLIEFAFSRLAAGCGVAGCIAASLLLNLSEQEKESRILLQNVA